jgi:endoglucanase
VGNAQTPVERHGLLRAKGNRIVDQHGEPVVLRGMSLFWAQWMPQFYNADVVRWLRKDWNVNVIRAAIPPVPNGYVQKPTVEMAKLERVIDAAIEQGIYVIVDWHAHEPHTEAAARFFEAVAKKYGSHPNIIYETWNEPLPAHDWSKTIKPHHERLIQVIRAHDPDNLITAGTQSWSQDVEKVAADPLSDPNLAYVLHFYAATHKKALRDKAQKALDAGLPLFVTEYGITRANGDDEIDVAESRRWWDFMEKNGISYLAWSIADKDEKSAALMPGASATGGWKDDEISESGQILREHLRRMNPKAEGATW